MGNFELLLPVFKQGSSKYDPENRWGGVPYTLLAGPWDQNYFIIILRYYIVCYTHFLMSVQWSIPEATCDIMTEIDMPFQLSFLKPDINEICKNAEQDHSSH